METSDWIVLAGVVVILAFPWKLQSDIRGLDRVMRGLSDRVARLEGLRDNVAGRARQGAPR